MFESHLYGIETNYHQHAQNHTAKFESHLYGIETSQMYKGASKTYQV